ncbi:glycosyltransferase family 1 protein [Candidatus Poribacteria bacterium]|nr:glycosyltransferase family 1 protein [Candidatus Poribacteria bacterium]
MEEHRQALLAAGSRAHALARRTQAWLSRYEEAREWMAASRGAICYYGLNQPARVVQMRGLQDAAHSLGIAFELVFVGAEAQLEALAERYDELLVFVSLDLLPAMALLTRSARSRALLHAPCYGRGGDIPRGCRQITEAQIHSLEESRELIGFVVTDFSDAGNQRYYPGYATEHGIPVLSFPWGVNVARHFPVLTDMQADVVFLGTYFEKGPRIDAFLTPILKRHRHTIVGTGWSESPFGVGDTMLSDFNAAAPLLYSSHAVSLNIHHDWETEGYTCNERAFNSVACGGFPVSDNAPRIFDFFSADEYVVAGEPDEYAATVAHYVDRPGDREAVMARAQSRVFAEHTYHHRLSDLLLCVFGQDTDRPYCPLFV